MKFVKAADLVTKAVSANEKGNLVYGLSKTLDDDVTFWSYAIWEDEAALKKHIESSYARAFIKYILVSSLDVFGKENVVMMPLLVDCALWHAIGVAQSRCSLLPLLHVCTLLPSSTNFT